MADVLVVDNHDSFVHTLVGYLHELGATTRMIEADAVADPVAEVQGSRGILVSPGPGRPEDAGASIDVVRTAAARGIPLRGVCLGHRALAVAFGARVTEAPELLHGITSAVGHDGDELFAGLPSPLTATRYHSLAVQRETLPDTLEVTAWTADGEIMGFQHRTRPIHGVQFHPESIATEHGHAMLANFLDQAGVKRLTMV